MIPKINVVKLESIIEDKAFLNPSLTAIFRLFPSASSSLILSKIKMLASTDKPMVSTIPAIPGSVSTAPREVNIPIIKKMFATKATSATQPALL